MFWSVRVKALVAFMNLAKCSGFFFAQSVLTAQADMRHTPPPARSALARPPQPSHTARPSMDDGQSPFISASSVYQYPRLASTQGVIFCLNPQRRDAHQLIENVAEACSSPLALLLRQQWLRRDRFKRMLQLELHRTVFQVSGLPQ